MGRAGTQQLSLSVLREALPLFLALRANCSSHAHIMICFGLRHHFCLLSLQGFHPKEGASGSKDPGWVGRAPWEVKELGEGSVGTMTHADTQMTDAVRAGFS